MTVETPAREAHAVHRFLAAAFEGFDEEGIPWCVLRGEDELDGSAGDVDLLLDPGGLERAHRLLARLGFARIRAWGHGSHTFFLAYDPDGDAWLWLDVVTDVRFGRYQNLRVPAEQRLLARSGRRDGVRVLARDDAFWMILLHSLLDKDAVPPKHRPRLVALADEARDEGPLARVLEASSPDGWTAARVVDAVRSREWEALDDLGRRLRRELTDSRVEPEGFRRLANRALRAATRVRRGLATPGPIVALLAPDGAGKTTLAAALEHSFPTYDVRVVYMGLYRDGRLDRARQLPGVYVASRVALAWARYLRARIHSAAGRLVVLDRYVYDVLVPATDRVGRAQRAHRWLVGHSLPAPDLVLVLDVPGTAAFARKREDDARSLEHQRAGYLGLAARLPRARVVDAGEDADAVRRRAISLIWTACTQRLDGR